MVRAQANADCQQTVVVLPCRERPLTTFRLRWKRRFPLPLERFRFGWNRSVGLRKGAQPNLQLPPRAQARKRQDKGVASAANGQPSCPTPWTRARLSLLPQAVRAGKLKGRWIPADRQAREPRRTLVGLSPVQSPTSAIAAARHSGAAKSIGKTLASQTTSQTSQLDEHLREVDGFNDQWRALEHGRMLVARIA
jgi:hypothetical protein